MWQAEGHEVILYGPDEIECEPDEHVVISTEADRVRWGFGGPEGYDTTKPFEWDWSKPYWQETAVRAIDALRERMPAERRGHFLCLVTSTQKPIADAIAGPRWNNPIAVEWAVGYEGIVGPFCAFESYAWQSHVYGLRGWRHGRAFDAVIPNFFDPAQFSPAERPTADYLLFIGRLIDAKGPGIAAEIAQRVGLPLKVAGPGATSWRPSKKGQRGRIEAPGVVIEGDVEYMGVVRYRERSELMANAVCTLAPTKYIEPFGGVAVEAMMAGCPVVASDWGAFPELLTERVGRTFRTLRQGVQAVREAMDLDRGEIRRYAVERFSLDAVGPLFTAWLDSLDSLWEAGFYAP